MLLASQTFDTVEMRIRPFDAENLGSVGQRAAELPAFKGLKKSLPIGPSPR